MKARLVALAGLLGLAGPILAQSVTPRVASRYLAVADRASKIASADRGTMRRQLDAAHDSVLAVLEYLRSAGRGEDALRMMADLDPYWTDVQEQVGEYAQVFAMPSAQAPNKLRATALLLAARDAHRIDDQAKVRAWANEAIRIGHQIGDSSTIGVGYMRLMYAALRDKNHTLLRALGDTGEPFCIHRDDPCEAGILTMRGESARALAQYDSALVYYQRNAAITAPNSAELHNMGFAYLGTGQARPARERFVTALRIVSADDDKRNMAYMFAGLASSAVVAGQPDSAARLFGIFDALIEQTHSVPDPADAIEYNRYRERGRSALGAAAFDRLVQEGRRLPVDSVVAAVLRTASP